MKHLLSAAACRREPRRRIALTPVVVPAATCADKVDNKQGQVQVKRHAGAVVSRRLIVLTGLAVVRKAEMAVPIT